MYGFKSYTVKHLQHQQPPKEIKCLKPISVVLTKPRPDTTTANSDAAPLAAEAAAAPPPATTSIQYLGAFARVAETTAISLELLVSATTLEAAAPN